ncbi:dienelactone hydrolase family protein [Lutibacter sp. A64]|uniref:carboxylesterase family protein n=1 Tax=Lutibacter sp. A64 TaxID=2918526 RepID=UPI001F0604BA|nr:dienelactone hydrolase family protein [Lutibacter sp. A64]UMB52591.1 dienelactone hydrolase family protein [Lutibacter sp. A64]
MRIVIVLIFSVLSQFAFAQTLYLEAKSSSDNCGVNEQENGYYVENSKPYIYIDENGLEMPYRVFLPSAYNPKKKYPLLLSFHGAGSRGNDNLKQMRPWVAGWMDAKLQKEHPCIILMPQCPKKQQWVNVPWKNGSYFLKDIPLSKPMKLAKEIFDKVVREYSVDKKRIYVMGVSMGGYGAWNFVMRYHKLIAAAVPICGAADPLEAKNINRIPIWAFHGDKDPTVPISGSIEMIEALYKHKKNKARLTIYKGIGHNSYEYAWKEPELIEWVFSQKK